MCCAMSTCRTPNPMLTVPRLLDAGGFSGTAEAAYYVSNLQRKVEIPKGVTACADGYTGTIMKQQVAVITTGVCACIVKCPSGCAVQRPGRC